ncbi:iron(III) transport system substrate-binding protein [Halorientalis persicus]|jgi:iron(III) transport system substrate-binding protein|uniref:Iron(III) transport system substrate-binding protein n=1 Tax=Halorientalis persicus TaxID=1367881 RepID=A0A1H8UNW9_9EURY|nr:extracellular solute-binding protein [Halorientalis persicus]SEP04707.1 iron(III) transport system substrate-binding protein [Halorientalis persicus]
MEDEVDSHGRSVSRRRLLQGGAVLGTASVAGCFGMFSDDGGNSTPQNANVSDFRGTGPLVEGNFRGSGRLAQGRPYPGGTSINDLPDLEGDLALYIGGGEGGIYTNLINKLESIYPDFSVQPSSNDSASLAQSIVEEVNAGASQADMFWSIDASSLGYVADNDAYESLSDEAVAPVGNAQFVGDDNAWAGVAGRARAVPYNTNRLSASDIPNKVQQFPESSALQGTMGWAPTYGAFKSFVTAMRLIQNKETTRQWLVDMREAGTERYGNEYAVSQNVANGSLAAGFANHYYALRVKNQRPNAPLELAFTEGDAGALVNISGAMKIKGTDKGELVDNFVRHLLSAEAQEFFATVSFSYPMIEGVEPVGDLPTVGELSPPDIDLSRLSNVQDTIELMESANVSP